MHKNPHDKETGTDVKGANIWNDSYAARLLRVIWESPDGVPQSVLMNMHYDLGLEAGGRKSTNKSSFQNTWDRLLKESTSWSGPRTHFGNRFDRPIAQRSVDGKNVVVWTGPSQEEWISSMSDKEIAKAHESMERQMTKYQDELDEAWVLRLDNEMVRRKGGTMRKNPGEVEVDESFAMSAGRYYAREWTSYRLGKFPRDEEFTSDLIGSIDIVSDTMKSGRRAEAYNLAFDVVESLPGRPETNAWIAFKTMNVVLVSDHIIHMWNYNDDGWGDIGVEMMIQRWVTSNYGGGYTFDGIAPTLALMHYRADLDKMIEFAKTKAWQPADKRWAKGPREWRKSDNGTNGTSVWWWSDEVQLHLESHDLGLEHEDFTIGFVMGLAQFLDKNASIYRDAPGMKQNPGERRDDEPFDMQGGRFIAFDVHSPYSISLKGADKINDLALVESILEPLSIASDTIERDSSAVDQAYDIIEDTLAEVPELQELNDHAVNQWLGPKTVLAFKGKIVGVVIPVEYGTFGEVDSAGFQPRMVAVADTLAKPGWRRHDTFGVENDGTYLLAQSKNQPDPLRADIYNMNFDPVHVGNEYTAAESDKAHKQFMLGYWMEALRVVRKMKNAKRRVNPAPLSDKEWWDGVLDKKRKKNPPTPYGSFDAEKLFKLVRVKRSVAVVAQQRAAQAMRVMWRNQGTDKQLAMEEWPKYFVDLLEVLGDAVDSGDREGAKEAAAEIHAPYGMRELNPSFQNNGEWGNRQTMRDLGLPDDGSPSWHDYLIAYWIVILIAYQLEVTSKQRQFADNPTVDQNDVADREAAVKMYKTFWRMEPTKIGEFHQDFQIPTKVKEIGAGHSIMYRSLKTDPETLQKPKKPVDYIHHFDAGVHMYGPSSSGGVSVPSWIAEVTSLTLLGSCLGWEIKVGGKMREAEGVAPLPELYTIPEGRALLVIQDKREVLAVFWGGDLGVEGRGIVH